MKDETLLGGMASGFLASMLIALVGAVGMALVPELYCLVPLTAVGVCLSLMFGVWVFVGFFVGEW